MTQARKTIITVHHVTNLLLNLFEQILGEFVKTSVVKE